MSLKSFTPTTPGRRQMTVMSFAQLSKRKPEKRLTRGKQRISGRNSLGRVTVRHRGGGHKRRYRVIDFLRSDKLGITARVVSIEYDPNRSAWIALLQYADGEKRYILAPDGLAVGDSVVCGDRTKLRVGNRLRLEHIPVGFKVHNVEIAEGRGGAIVRAAGGSAVLVSLDGPYAQVRLPSGEVRFVGKRCFATVGSVSNPEHNLVSIGKAGRMRWMGRRPQVLGKSMNPVDHPHGGGEGHSPIGLKSVKTPWGKRAFGVRTRRKRHYADRWIAVPRPRTQGRRKK